jgi:hypothetical protein
MIGPQVEAKPRMKRHAKTIMALPECGVDCGFVRSREKCPTEAKTRKQVNIHTAPKIRDLRRPKCSIT